MLSKNPVVVSGISQISWTRLQFSLVFLASIRDEKYSDAFELRKWLNVAHIWGTNHTRPGGSLEYIPRLEDYQLFCSRFTKACSKHQNIRSVVLLLALLAITITTLEIFKEIIGFQGFFIIFWLMLIAVIYFLCVLAIESCLRHRLLPGPTINILDMPLSKRSGITHNFQSQTMEAMCTRSAKDPRDMTFGVHAVFKSIASGIQIPPVDYTLPKGEIYRQFTTYLLSSSLSLRFLVLAVQQHCEGAASWVPDFWHDLQPDWRDVAFHSSGKRIGKDVTRGSFYIHRLRSEL